MYRLAFRYLTNHHDVEDVLTVSFMKVLNKINHFTYQGDGSLLKWIRTIVINESIRHLKSKKQIQYEDDIAAVCESSFNPIEIESVDTEKIQHIIKNMPSGYRLVFNLFAIEGYKHTEISIMLAISVNTSKTQLKKARNYIIKRIQK